MPYDDSILKELSGYFEAKEPGPRERADAWATAIGLQKVDGLSPSRYLVSLAKRHIEGEITQRDAHRLLKEYYEAHDEQGDVDPALEEPDKVSERIVALINEPAFAFSPETLKSIHRRLFRGVLPGAGDYRTTNLRKHEWVLNEDSVTYAAHEDIAALLKSDFRDESEFDYAGRPAEEIIPHFASFVACIWQRHPFREGNTRTTAVFAVKYLRQLGYAVQNNMFAENSWYFRNALVRANYMGLGRRAGRTTAYLVAFFRNLLLGEKNELKSRYLRIGCDRTPPTFGEKAVRKSGQEKAVRKVGGNTSEKILAYLAKHPKTTQADLVATFSLARSTVQKHLANLKSARRLRRVGPDKGGHWAVDAPFGRDQ
jgi:fido (protein-threonine AMPylation protein)